MASNDEWINVNNYWIFHDENDVYTAYGEESKVMYSVSRREDNNFVLKLYSKCDTAVPIIIDGEKPFNFEMMKPDCVIHSRSGKEITLKDFAVTKMVYDVENGEHIERLYNDENIVESWYDSSGKIIYRETDDNHLNVQLQEDFINKTTSYYSKDGNLYCVEYEDGRKEYSYDEDPFIIYKDGTFSYKKSKGNYTIDSNNNFICVDEDNNQIFLDSVGHKYKEITANGTVYDYDKNSQATIRNGKVSYTTINHIEYDEEAYDNILNSLNNVESSYSSTIESAYSNISDTVGSFPDSCSFNVMDIANGIRGHITLVNSLKESINYSLLAYQATESDLKDALNILIDDLFGESEIGLATIFKHEIYNTIEDRDNDKIMEYKKGTNFNTLTRRAIPASSYVDQNGNTIYLNKNSIIIGIDGNSTQISFSNTIFNLSSGEDGILKLTDKDGKSLNIFGDYNIDSSQYGSNQMHVEYAYNDDNVMNMISKYYPTATMEEKTALLSKITNKGCGYAAITNLIFKEFEGNENSFYETYGFPMYDVRKITEDIYYIDYNYEPVIVDLFCKANDPNAMGNINYLVQNGAGVNKERITRIFNYLKDTKGIHLSNTISAENIIGDRGYCLRDLDGEIMEYHSDTAGHIMLITEHDEAGNSYVSSWGQKFMLEKILDESYADNYENIWKGVMNND